MTAALTPMLAFFQRFHTLAAHPLAVVIVLALIAALVEQRLARRRTPDFSVAWRDIKGPPPKAGPPRREP